MTVNKDKYIIDVDELTWKEARLLLIECNPLLVKIIDFLSPSDDYKLYKARYRFGTKIFDKSESYLPLVNGGTISFNNDLLPDYIRLLSKLKNDLLIK